MDIEFHYYITYIAAILAGYPPLTAYIIAYSAQYVDDNTYLIKVEHLDGTTYFSCPTQLYSARYSSRFINTIYPVYHFIPGETDIACKRRLDGRKHTLLVTPDSNLANTLMSWACTSDNLYVIGIASHAFADTWAHQNFAGIEHEVNSIASPWFKHLIPNIGHADMLYSPDLLHVEWQDSRLRNPYICNALRFAAAAQRLFLYYAEAMEKHSRKKQLTLANALRDWVINLTMHSQVHCSTPDAKGRRYRLGQYAKAAYAISAWALPEYHPKLWFNAALKPHVQSRWLYFQSRNGYHWRKADYQVTRWYQFQQAAKMVKRFLMPKLADRF